jgi:hypothetical protein
VREEIPAYDARAKWPYVRVPAPTPPNHNYFYPATVHQLPLVEISMDPEPEKQRARRRVGIRIASSPRRVPLSPQERRMVDELFDRERPASPCEVTVAIDPEAPDTLTVQAVRHGDGVAYEATLVNEDKARVVVVVYERGKKRPKELAPATIVEVSEDEVGDVQVRFEVRLAPEKMDEYTTILYIKPDYMVIWRKGEHDRERKDIARLEFVEPVGPAPGAGRPVGPRRLPPGHPDAGRRRAPGFVRPAPRRPGAAPATVAPPAAQKAKEFTFKDLGAESETAYTYWVQTVKEPDPEGLKLPPRDSEPYDYKTKAKFSFAYVGGGSMKANIIVFIGSRDDPKDRRGFRVPIGGWVGDMPGELRAVAEKAEPEDKKGAGAAAKPAPKLGGAMLRARPAAGARFVTRFTLVDIVQGAIRVVEEEREVVVGTDAEGRLIREKRKFFRVEETTPHVVLRSRKNRLIRLWRETPSKISKLVGK